MTTNSADTADTAIAKETVEANGAQSQRTNPPTLRLDNVSYAYAKGGKRVLKNISHDFQAGKVHAITGPSGAGKTTLLSLISGLATPTEGIVLVDGADLSERDRYRFRSHDIGVIFQNFNLLPNLTVAENIILSMDVSGKTFDKSKRTIVEELLERFKTRIRRDQFERVLEPVVHRSEIVDLLGDRVGQEELVVPGPLESELEKLVSGQGIVEVGLTVPTVVEHLFAAGSDDHQLLFQDPLAGRREAELVDDLVDQQLEA